MKYIECKRCGKWSPRIALIGNVAVAVFKFVVGVVAGSKGLVADSVHSVADATSSLFILIALKVSGKPKDKSHPYGHGKIEYLSTITASIFILSCAAMIFLDALHSLKSGTHNIPGNVAIVATVLCLVYSLLLSHSTHCAGTMMNSPALLADSAESKADSLASLAVLLGLIGTKVGFVYADTIAALLVSFLVFYISVVMLLKGINGMMDVAVDGSVLEEIKELCLNINGVEGIRALRSRSMGQKCNVDIDLEILRSRTVLEADQLSEQVKRTIREKMASVDYIFVKTFPVGKWRLWT